MELPSGFSAGEQVLDALWGLQDRATAIFATNPMTSLGIMRRAQERGIAVPHDLSLVGVDDSDVRLHVWPRMSAVTQDASALGLEAAQWLTRVIVEGQRNPVCPAHHLDLVRGERHDGAGERGADRRSMRSVRREGRNYGCDPAAVRGGWAGGACGVQWGGGCFESLHVRRRRFPWL